MALRRLAVFYIQALAVSALAIEKRAACSSYSKGFIAPVAEGVRLTCSRPALLNTRGTGEPQGTLVDESKALRGVFGATQI